MRPPNSDPSLHIPYSLPPSLIYFSPYLLTNYITHLIHCQFSLLECPDSMRAGMFVLFCYTSVPKTVFVRRLAPNKCLLTQKTKVQPTNLKNRWTCNQPSSVTTQSWPVVLGELAWLHFGAISGDLEVPLSPGQLLTVPAQFW